jgi:hypothetical protein
METITKSVKKEKIVKTADEIRIMKNERMYRYRDKHSERYKIYQAAYQKANYWKYRGAATESFLNEQKRMFGILLENKISIKKLT